MYHRRALLCLRHVYCRVFVLAGILIQRGVHRSSVVCVIPDICVRHVVSEFLIGIDSVVQQAVIWWPCSVVHTVFLRKITRPFGRFQRSITPETKRLPIPNAIRFRKRSQQNLSNATTFGTDALLTLWGYRALKIYPSVLYPLIRYTCLHVC